MERNLFEEAKEARKILVQSGGNGHWLRGRTSRAEKDWGDLLDSSNRFWYCGAGWDFVAALHDRIERKEASGV